MNRLYVPGHSILHRAPAAAKFAALLMFTSGLLVLHSPVVTLAGAGMVLAGFLAAGLTLRQFIDQVWPLRWFVLAIAAFQFWVGGWRDAWVYAGGLAVMVSAANLVTMTTRISAVMDALVRALRPARRIVDPERVALVVGLTITSIPVMTRILEEARQARAARGQEREWRTLLSSVVIRALHHADQVGEALAARGADD